MYLDHKRVIKVLLKTFMAFFFRTKGYYNLLIVERGKEVSCSGQRSSEMV